MGPASLGPLIPYNSAPNLRGALPPKEGESVIPRHILLRIELRLSICMESCLSPTIISSSSRLEGEGSLEEVYPPKVGLFQGLMKW